MTSKLLTSTCHALRLHLFEKSIFWYILFQSFWIWSMCWVVWWSTGCDFLEQHIDPRKTEVGMLNDMGKKPPVSKKVDAEVPPRTAPCWVSGNMRKSLLRGRRSQLKSSGTVILFSAWFWLSAAKPWPILIVNTMWVFPKIMVPPNHPFVHRVWNHYFHHPFWVPLFLEISMCL